MSDPSSGSTAEQPAGGSPGAGGSGIDLARSALAAARAAAGRRKARTQERRAAVTRRSGARPDDRDPQPVAATIDRLLAERGWEKPAAIGGVMGRWPEIVGAEVAAHCTPDSYEDGILTVSTDSTAWATQVRLLAAQFVRRVNEEIGDGTVERIVVQGPSGPSWRRGGRSVRDGRGPRDTYG